MGGLVIAGNAPERLLVRAAGPALANFGISDYLADPDLQLFQGQTVIAQNDGWNGNATVASVASHAQAFPFPANSRDAAMVYSFGPASYTVGVTSASGGSGVILFEVYEAPSD
ncbi:MAG: hypothetical protein ACREFX_12630 [Opitutaceae bacterium]